MVASVMTTLCAFMYGYVASHCTGVFSVHYEGPTSAWVYFHVISPLSFLRGMSSLRYVTFILTTLMYTPA